MTTTAPQKTRDTGSPGLLQQIMTADDAVRAAEIERLGLVVEYAVAHPPIDAADRSRVTVPAGGVEGRTESLPLNESGVPVVSACAVAELGAVLQLSTEAARTLVAEALELSYRLPGLWERVMAGDLPVWKARRVAAATVCLKTEVVQFVHTQLQAVPGQYGPAMLERLIDAALYRHDSTERLRRIAAAADTRRLDVHLDQTTLGGTAPVSGVLSLPDALAFDAAVAHGAAQLLALGSTESLDARRARAGGDMAREHLALFAQPVPTKIWIDEDGGVTPVEPDPISADMPGADFDTTVASAGVGATAGVTKQQRRRASRREILLVAHINAAALTTAGAGSGGCTCGSGSGPVAHPGETVVGRVENTRTPVDVDAIRGWLGDVNAKVTVQPVIDLAEQIHAQQYETPVRLRRQVCFRDITCVFPFCNRPATINVGRTARRRDRARDRVANQATGAAATASGASGAERTSGTRAQVFAVDLDHITPYHHDHPSTGGQTTTSNLAPLCRHHHGLKTSRGWTYAMTSLGVFAWTSPAGYRYRRDHTGTRLLLGSDTATSGVTGRSEGSDLPGSRGPAPPET